MIHNRLNALPWGGITPPQSQSKGCPNIDIFASWILLSPGHPQRLKILNRTIINARDAVAANKDDYGTHSMGTAITGEGGKVLKGARSM